MNFSARFPCLLAVTGLCLSATLFAQTAPKAADKAAADHASRVAQGLHLPGSVAITPDSTTIAWTVRGREGSSLHVTTLADPDPAKDKIVTPSSETACSNNSPVWSPDSQWLAFTSTCTSKEEKPGQEQIFLWSRADGKIKQLTHVTGNIEQAAWSPDGKNIAFLFVENATRSAGALDAMKPWAGVIGEDGVEIQRVAIVPVPNPGMPVARVKLGVPRNGKSSIPSFDAIARNPGGMPSCSETDANNGTPINTGVRYAEGRALPIPTCLPSNSAAVQNTSQSLQRGNQLVRVADETPRRDEGTGAVPADTGVLQVTPTTLHVYEFSWSPDSERIAFIAAPPPGENNWWVAQLYIERIGHAREEPVSILDPQKVAGALHGLQIAVPRWSPDGKRLCFIGGLMSDQGSTGGDVWVIPAKGGEPVDVTPGIDGSPTYALWVNDRAIGFVEDRRGHTLLVDWDTEKRALLPGGELDLGEVSIGGGPIKNGISYGPANGGVLAFTENGFSKAPEIWTVDKDNVKQVTHLNDGMKPTVKIESIEWENEGFHVQGWLSYPINYDPKKTYPMIVTVHGGPSASAYPRSASWAPLGYFEFQPNPRGSFGQGEAFTAANRKDFGYGDLRDILTGIDAIEKKVSVDDKRIGLTGWSYGGFMSMFAETQTNRFRAIVAGAGISDWKSYYGENSIDQWMIPFFGASVYDDPAVYAKSSAIEYIKNAKTPMLIIVGDRDGECPAPQSFEMWHALKAQGVKTQLVVYPNEGHGFRDPEHQKDRAERTAKWFADNMPAK